jgi:hypothetical protein
VGRCRFGFLIGDMPASINPSRSTAVASPPRPMHVQIGVAITFETAKLHSRPSREHR